MRDVLQQSPCLIRTHLQRTTCTAEHRAKHLRQLNLNQRQAWKHCASTRQQSPKRCGVKPLCKIGKGKAGGNRRCKVPGSIITPAYVVQYASSTWNHMDHVTHMNAHFCSNELTFGSRGSYIPFEVVCVYNVAYLRLCEAHWKACVDARCICWRTCSYM